MPLYLDLVSSSQPEPVLHACLSALCISSLVYGGCVYKHCQLHSSFAAGKHVPCMLLRCNNLAKKCRSSQEALLRCILLWCSGEMKHSNLQRHRAHTMLSISLQGLKLYRHSSKHRVTLTVPCQVQARDITSFCFWMFSKGLC